MGVDLLISRKLQNRMKSLSRISAILLSSFFIVSCYEDFTEDYKYSATYFASQKPLRTVIADRNMSIKVGAAIGGKREVDMNDWVRFEIDPALLDGTGLKPLPVNCYTLADQDIMKVSKKTVPVADVEISFTPDFYALPDAEKTTYAIPFRIVESSLDTILEDKSTSIVAIKYISSYHGTYYVSGELQTLDDDGNVIKTEEYRQKDLSKNITRSVYTIDPQTVCKQGFANKATDNANEAVQIEIHQDASITVSSISGGVAVTDGSGSMDTSGDRLIINLDYKFEKDGVKYRAIETLTRRQDPMADLRYEEW